jgi:membrane-associated phospholipid phosphatase
MIAVAVFCARWLVIGFAAFGIFLLTSPRKQDRHTVHEAAWSAALALIATAAIAALVGRARPFLEPFDATAPIALLIPPPFNTSFPSGHTAVSFAIASAILYANRPVGIAAILAALLVTIGRMAVGVHYPSDIAGGIVVGVLCFALVRLFHRQIHTRDIDRAAKKHVHA